MPLTAEQEELIGYIDEQVNQVLLNGGDDRTLMIALVPIMNDLGEIINSATDYEMDLYCQEYEGFYRFMKLLEELASGISNGTIPVPD